MGQHGKHRPLVAKLVAALLAAACLAVAALAAPAPASANCRQALAMGLDVSGSVDANEYRLQLDGLAAALGHQDVVAALLAMPSAPVRLAIYEWSAPGDQRLLLPWTDITDSQALAAIIARLHATTRAPAGPSTALGVAMSYGARLLATQSECWKRTLDISGDGRSNTGPRPQDVARRPELEGITVNALVIGPGNETRGDLSAYFKTLVIRGPDAFVEQADAFAAYEQAMVRKLLRELQGLAMSELDLR